MLSLDGIDERMRKASDIKETLFNLRAFFSRLTEKTKREPDPKVIGIAMHGWSQPPTNWDPDFCRKHPELATVLGADPSRCSRQDAVGGGWEADVIAGFTERPTWKERDPRADTDGRKLKRGHRVLITMTRGERWDVVKRGARCKNCFKRGHMASKCRAPPMCKKCPKYHHTLLHIEDDKMEGTKKTYVTPSTPEAKVLLMTCTVNVIALDGSVILKL